MIVIRPCRADDHVAPFHRVSFVFADKHSILRCLADKPGFTPQVAMALGALAGHQNLRVHPNRKFSRLDANDGAHSRHAICADGNDLSRTHEAAINTVPLPVCRGICLARRGPSFTPEPRTDEMMLGEKLFEIFMSGSNVNHKFYPLVPASLRRLERLEQLERSEPFQ